MRRVASFLAVCLTVPAVALAADTDPKKRITPSDRAKARSIVLKRSDFAPGWKQTPASPDSDATCPGFNPDGSDLTITGEAEADFKHTAGFPMVFSGAEIYASKSDAVKAWSRTAKPALARCLAHFFREGIVEEGGTVKILKQGVIAFPKLGQRSIALRVVARVTVEEPGQAPVVLPFTIHAVAVGHGRGDASLLTMGFGDGVAPAELRAFAALLAKRLAAAKL